jgi:thermitase
MRMLRILLSLILISGFLFGFKSHVHWISVEWSDDPYYGLQWGLDIVNAEEAWSVIHGDDVDIAIVDTGISEHEDLEVSTRVNFTPYPDGDVVGHGTHVAGIASAVTGNNLGISGMGYNARLIDVKVIGDKGMGQDLWIAAGIKWAADNGAEIINLSLGTSIPIVCLEEAVNYAWEKGCLIVASAGNTAKTDPNYPAYYEHCIAVGATTSADERWFASAYGDWVDVAAPGEGIYSTTIDGYGYKSGTSMAAPFVCGLAALVWNVVSDQNGNGFVNDEVRDKIKSTCDNIGVFMRINAAKAVGYAPQPPPPPPPPELTAMWIDNINYEIKGKNLFIEASTNHHMSNILVEADINGSIYSTHTNGKGEAIFKINKASGLYEITIKSLAYDNYVWDTTKGIISAQIIV